MKRLLCLWGVVAIFCLGICGLAAAETVGNTADINLPSGRGIYSAGLGDFISLRAGFDVEFLNKIEFTHDPEVTSNPKLEGVYYMGKFGLTLFDRIQPYVSLGVAELEMSWNDTNGTVKVETSTAPSWGAGLKAYLWEFEGLDLKIFSAASFRVTKTDRLRTVSVGNTSGGITGKKFQIFERQIALGVSKAISVPGYESISIVPYAGGTWSDTNARVNITQGGTNKINSGAKGQDKNLGIFLGADFMFADNFSLNLEGRFIDQEAISAGFTALI